MNAVAAPLIAALTIAWKPPTANADGSTPVTPLASYAIWQGTSATALGTAPVATVPATQLTYTTPLLPAGTYFFALESVALDGKNSVMSNVVSAHIYAPAVPGAPTSITISAVV